MQINKAPLPDETWKDIEELEVTAHFLIFGDSFDQTKCDAKRETKALLDSVRTKQAPPKAQGKKGNTEMLYLDKFSTHYTMLRKEPRKIPAKRARNSEDLLE